ncbi:uncharacterized protein LOC128553990 isoform X1 [Mercenaria mercenaria]|uniref:uncharacterized protein LOC128553990 isoform X1 n=1 Tax=Mercenaria mercenaria TaxID=6596 RepID=UPI00234EF484|nr:uncharacterized protein LOC128553990 isoform X1 [Mercenaria mercenaria]
MSRDETQPASLKELTSLKEFTEALHQINIETVDKKAVQRLINASVNIVSTRMREGHRIQEQSLLLDLQNMQSQLIPLMFELEQHRFLTDLSHIDKSVLDGLQLLLQSLKAPTQISLTPHGLQMLKKISSKLRYKEKEKLRQKYQWTPDGKIEKSMAEDPNLFLACLYHKEIERTRLYIHCQSFVAECLTEVGREDLKKFLEPKPQPNPPNPPSPRYFTEARQKADPSQGQNSQQHHKQQQAQRQETPQFQPQYQDQSVLITRMAQQIQEMYNTLQTKQNLFALNLMTGKPRAFLFHHKRFKIHSKFKMSLVVIILAIFKYCSNIQIFRYPILVRSLT